MLNDFMNCRMRISLRLLGVAQRKNSAVTTMKGSSRPAGISGAAISSFCDGPRSDPINPVEMLKMNFLSQCAPEARPAENEFFPAQFTLPLTCTSFLSNWHTCWQIVVGVGLIWMSQTSDRSVDEHVATLRALCLATSPYAIADCP